LFTFLDPKNKKVKAKNGLPLHYPTFFEEAARHLSPIILEASDTESILANVASSWRHWQQGTAAGRQMTQPDEILIEMKRDLSSMSFWQKVQGKYRAVIIDEFQDTDPLQWDIFKTLFLESSSKIEAFYLVGDPKQSIYRFRKADVYTYLSAKAYLGE